MGGRGAEGVLGGSRPQPAGGSPPGSPAAAGQADPPQPRPDPEGCFGDRVCCVEEESEPERLCGWERM